MIYACMCVKPLKMSTVELFCFPIMFGTEEGGATYPEDTAKSCNFPFYTSLRQYLIRGS